jgi:hypothetical protein
MGGKKEQEINNKNGRERIKDENGGEGGEKCMGSDTQLFRSCRYTTIRGRLKTSAAGHCLSPYLPTTCES